MISKASFSILIVLLVVGYKPLSQGNNYSFEITDEITNTNYQLTSKNVSSDYGRRESSTSKFHRGVDFNVYNFTVGADGSTSHTWMQDEGFTIKSINAGRIARLYLDGSYKIISIDGDDGINFAYGHIFGNTGNDTQSGQFLMHNAAAPLNERVIIYHPGQVDSYMLTDATDASIANIVYSYPPGVTPPATVYSVANRNLRNRVDPDDEIAPIGNSGFVGPHVHLYKLENASETTTTSLQEISNCKDPLYDLSETEFQNPDYELDILVNQEHLHTLDNSTTILNAVRVRVDWSGSADEVTTSDNQLYAGAVLDINGVEVLIKKSSEVISDYKLVEGQLHLSKIYEGSVLGPGGDSETYPNFIIDNKIEATTSAGFGGLNKTGIVGLSYLEDARNNQPPGPAEIPAYVTANYPNGNTFSNGDQRRAVEDYFFNDFPSRIKWSNSSELAKEISEARYEDGEYHLIAQAVDIYGDRHPSDRNETPTSIIIDNFKPYVLSVIVRKLDPLQLPDNSILYRGTWEWDENATVPILFKTTNLVDFDNGFPFEVTVTTSEPMTTVPLGTGGLSLRMEAFGTSVFAPTEVSADLKTFTFSLPALPLLPTNEQNQPQTLYFDGYDLNNNQLDQNPQTIAVRTGATTWTAGADPGESSNFIMNSGGSYCSSGGNIANNGASQQSVANSGAASTSTVATGCNYVDIQESKQNPQVGEAITLTAITGPYTNLSWDFGGDPGYPPLYDYNNKEEVTVVFTNEIDHTITLDIDGELATKVINVGASEPSFSFVLGKNRGSTMQIDDDVDFYVDYFIGIDEADILSYQWDFGNGAEYPTSTTASVDGVSYDTPGPKTITLTACTALSCQTVSVNNFIHVSGYPFPINASFTCPSEFDVSGVPNSGYVSITHPLVSGGDNEYNNETYYWDFGDGGSSTEKIGVHTYKDPGYYEIRLTVCDLSGCYTFPDDNPNFIECTLFVPESKFPPIVAPNFTINSELAVVNSVTQRQYIAEGLPFIIDDASTLFSGVDVDEEDVSYVVVRNGSEYARFDDDKGPHTVNLNNAQAGEVYTISYDYGGNFATGEVEIDCNSGLESCKTNIESLTFSSYCWDDANLLTISLGIDQGDCNYELATVQDNDVGSFWYQTSTNGQFTWPVNQKPSYFPYKTEILAHVYNCDFGTGNGGGVLDWQLFEVTIYGPEENIDVSNVFNICKGASTSIGVQPTSGLTYEWSASNTQHLQYLSSSTEANPVFSGLVNGTYNYTLNVSNLQSGCTFEQGVVSVTVGSSISPDSYARDVDVRSGGVALEAPIGGDGRSYEFQWSPTTYLDNPNVANPVFTPPPNAETITYTVTAGFRDCTATGTATIDVINHPPTDLIVDNTINGVLKLEWVDNSIESRFEVQRSEDGSSWETIDEVGSDITRYTDAYCLNPDIEYCYRIRGTGLNGGHINNEGAFYSNTACDKIEYELYEKYEVDYQGVRTHQNNPKIGKFYNYDENSISFLSIATINNVAGNTNPTHFLVDKETGAVTQNSYDATAFLSAYTSSALDIVYASAYAYLSGTNLYRVTSSGWSLEGNIDAAIPEKFLMQNGHEYYLFGSTTAYNDLNNDDLTCTLIGSNRQEVNLLSNVVAQRISQDLKEYLILDVEFATSQWDGYSNWFNYAIPLSNGNILIATDFECHQMPGPPETHPFVCHAQNVVEPCNLSSGLELIEVQGTTLSPVQNKRMSYGTQAASQIDNQKLLLADGNNFFLVGEANNGNSSSTNHRVWISKFDGNLNQLWEKTIKYNSEDTYFDGMVERKPGEYILVAHTDGITNNTHVYNLDNSGNVKWESHSTYDDASRIIDVHMIDKDNLILGGKSLTSVDTDHRTISVKKFSLNPDLTEPIEICDDVLADDSYARVGSEIDISKNNCVVNFESGSSTSLEATTSITLHPGAWIKSGAYFSANATEMITVGDCSDFGLPSSRVTAFLDEEFETPALDNNIYQVYPNPSTDQFQIELNFTEFQEIKLSLYDINGRMVWSDTGSGQYYYNQVQTTGLGSGLYLLRVESSNGEEKMMRVLISK